METHTLKEIVKDTDAILTHICAGKVYYQIYVKNSIYQLEIDSMQDERKETYLFPKFKAITLMRWIRKGIENNDGTFIQLK